MKCHFNGSSEIWQAAEPTLGLQVNAPKESKGAEKDPISKLMCMRTLAMVTDIGFINILCIGTHTLW